MYVGTHQNVRTRHLYPSSVMRSKISFCCCSPSHSMMIPLVLKSNPAEYGFADICVLLFFTGIFCGPATACNASSRCPENLFSHTLDYQYHPPGFVAWSKPEWVVLSGSHQALDRLAIDAYRQEGAHVLHTATSGAVTVTIDEHGLHVAAWRDPPLDALAPQP